MKASEIAANTPVKYGGKNWIVWLGAWNAPNKEDVMITLQTDWPHPEEYARISPDTELEVGSYAFGEFPNVPDIDPEAIDVEIHPEGKEVWPI